MDAQQQDTLLEYVAGLLVSDFGVVADQVMPDTPLKDLVPGIDIDSLLELIEGFAPVSLGKVNAHHTTVGNIITGATLMTPDQVA